MKWVFRAGVLALPLLSAPAAALPSFGTWDDARLAAAVAPCWNVASLSEGARRARFTVAFTLDAAGKPADRSFRLVESTAGGAVGQRAFAAARKAVQQCGRTGLPVPPGWRGGTVQSLFAPQGGRG
ncbi:hypothetical protein D2N39_08315 [Gemmobacter lutimaris]|uniref:Energy transducer TonB n=1 Tax=Gemmobacter lutimaris TaxID=2306023 RepID=A0A398BPZ6_9RHOB|nr:hypothetical protein [Gemmobacter lutimaris]RID92625.1 hypothetical protein D2N39_08315 [Gemmobacter lutimaris]